MENGNWRILVLWKTRIGEFFSFFFFYPRILVLLKRRILVLWKTGRGEFFFFFFIREFCLCGKPESENFFFLVFFLSENSRFLENRNRRIFFFFFIRVFWFCGKRVLEIFFFFFIREFSFCGKRESEKFFFLFFFYPRILVLLKRRFLVLWKTGTGEFCFFFFLSENSRFVENQNRRTFFFCFFFLSENSRFMENGNWRIFFFFFFYPRILLLWKTRIGEFFFFFFSSENSRFVENGN